MNIWTFVMEVKAIPGGRWRDPEKTAGTLSRSLSTAMLCAGLKIPSSPGPVKEHPGMNDSLQLLQSDNPTFPEA